MLKHIDFGAELDEFVGFLVESFGNVLVLDTGFAELDENGKEWRDLDPFVAGDLRRQPFKLVRERLLSFAKLLADPLLVESGGHRRIDIPDDRDAAMVGSDARRRRAFFAFLGEECEYSPSACGNGRDHGANRAKNR